MILKLIEVYEHDFTPKQNTSRLNYEDVRGKLFEEVIPTIEGQNMILDFIGDRGYHETLRTSTVSKINKYGNNEIEVHTRNTIYTFKKIDAYIAD